MAGYNRKRAWVLGATGGSSPGPAPGTASAGLMVALSGKADAGALASRQATTARPRQVASDVATHARATKRDPLSLASPVLWLTPHVVNAP
jgi:hypothetical protein